MNTFPSTFANNPRTFVPPRDNVLHKSTPVDGHIPIEHRIPNRITVGDMSLWLSNHAFSLPRYFTFHYLSCQCSRQCWPSVLHSLADLRWYSPLVVRLRLLLSRHRASLNRIFESVHDVALRSRSSGIELAGNEWIMGSGGGRQVPLSVASNRV
jgi:hypothetical protein